ncbi:MAG TPA: hypothetical protein VNO21_25085 [Polyangiaceae bacterium]|nr:hypothetical protein [Polyangiaceae bacterium]
MATKKSEGLVRGAALVKKSIEAARASGIVASPEPVSPNVLKKLRLPNDEKISPAMKELLAFDASFVGWAFDDEEPEFEPMALDELIEEELGEEHLGAFGEASEMLGEDCIALPSEGDTHHFLYIGTVDDRSEYPVIALALDGGGWVGGFVPFDVWIAQRFGALEKGVQRAAAPPGYEAACKALAESNGDGRVSFVSEHRDVGDGAEHDEDEDEEEESEDDAS